MACLLGASSPEIVCLINLKMLTFYAQIAAAERAPLVPSIVQQLDPFEGGCVFTLLGPKTFGLSFVQYWRSPRIYNASS